MTANAKIARPWLFGAAPDLVFGCGLGYALVVVLIAALGPNMDRIRAWLPLLVLVTGVPHYGATLERVFSTPQARSRYGLPTVLFGLLVWGAFVGTLATGIGASLLVTIYLTWSPWHYAAQNFGLGMMFLRRAGASISPLHRHLLKASFVFSFLLVVVNIHRKSAENVHDPLYAAAAVRDAVRFSPAGIPDSIASKLLVVFGVAYVVTTVASLVVIVRQPARDGRAPAIGLILSQSIWFVLPIVLGWFAPNAYGATALAFIWVAIAHSVQYLWISMHLAQVSGRVGETSSAIATYFGTVVFSGAALWVIPVLLSSKTGLSKMPHESGLDMLIAAAVNLHHFLVDGVIWKLRDAPVKKMLVEGHSIAHRDEESSLGKWFGRAALGVVGIISVASWIIATWEQEIGRRQAMMKGDVDRIELAAARLALIGRDGPRIHQNIAKLLRSRGDADAALVRYQQSVARWPTASAWVGIGKIQQEKGKLDEARRAFEAAIELEPANASAIDDLAHVFAAQGDFERAVQIQLRALHVAPERADLRRRYDALIMKMPVTDDYVHEINVDTQSTK